PRAAPRRAGAAPSRARPSRDLPPPQRQTVRGAGAWPSADRSCSRRHPRRKRFGRHGAGCDTPDLRERLARAGRAGPPGAEDDPRGLEEDPEIESERPVLHVVEVVPKLLHLLLEAVGIAVADLRPAGDPGPDQTPKRVVGDAGAAARRAP